MKKLYFSLLAVVISVNSFAQKADKTLATITYKLSHVKDTTQRDNVIPEEMIVFLGKNTAYYTSYDRIKRDIQVRKSIEEQIKNQGGQPTSISINRTSTTPVTNVDFYFFLKDNKFFEKENLINDYLIENPLDKPNWTITKETKLIADMKCTKATARFKGRNWTAWFNPDMPFQAGPWKLNNLPGLIAEAYDDKNEVRFDFISFEKMTPEKIAELKGTDNSNVVPGVKMVALGNSSTLPFEEIKLPENASQISAKELARLKEARDKDPQGFYKTQMAARGMDMGSMITTTGRRMTVAASVPAVKFTFNNPIELPEK
ncbi:GLPGLI family protein [Pedobacter montanisoli]|uniref:GLPGLI family protein n=1 Tax=Pedobacter montanisoli TaxID=2923277 RepID=A0ABS9ZXU2_9SPHI|nr:GLPGLI family protein [Pedobacter montanisoli]MCJ0743108.1 GLPGLI family protein [Pedobacter montanisoli]